jgi:ATP-dependent Clp protease adaptor protein ClpS
VGNKTQTESVVKVKTRVKLSPPRDHKVIFLDDNITPMEFVVASLIEIFEHDIDTAESLTEKVHNEGSAVIAVLPYEIAEHKGVETTILARSNGYPLQVKIEPE